MTRTRLTCLTLAVASVLLAATGCGLGEIGAHSLCSEAEAHLAACTGAPLRAVETCDENGAQLAEELLGTTCEELTQRVTAGAGNDAAHVGCLAFVLVSAWARDLPQGDPCCFVYQCAGSSSTCRDHICHQKSAVGGECEMSANCLGGLACVSRKCAKPRAKGQSCARSDECVQGLICSAAGKCGSATANGVSCSSNSQCASSACIKGKCASRAGKGGTCDDSSDCKSGTCKQGKCG